MCREDFILNILLLGLVFHRKGVIYDFYIYPPTMDELMIHRIDDISDSFDSSIDLPFDQALEQLEEDIDNVTR
ncbi:MAG: hypothetical protein HRU18_02595 [Pseudoalteromonas sp.]|uniref:hypothetical protein n=1 Tax=Pseudoalteromonas sp. TaxID=53249 RepID=UPI001DD08AA5|nr:hypothetical protein [Pseudoalteromonas sp.]NRA77072.1 hypothetical protein [Pseudoalteromonas sp.]